MVLVTLRVRCVCTGDLCWKRGVERKRKGRVPSFAVVWICGLGLFSRRARSDPRMLGRDAETTTAQRPHRLGTLDGGSLSLLVLL